MSALTVSKRYAVAAERSADWRVRAACRDHEADLWFPTGTTGPALEQEAQAKQICAACPVLAACRSWALRLPHDQDGIAGGLNPAERAQLRRKAGLR